MLGCAPLTLDAALPRHPQSAEATRRSSESVRPCARLITQACPWPAVVYPDPDPRYCTYRVYSDPDLDSRSRLEFLDDLWYIPGDEETQALWRRVLQTDRDCGVRIPSYGGHAAGALVQPAATVGKTRESPCAWPADVAGFAVAAGIILRAPPCSSSIPCCTLHSCCQKVTIQLCRSCLLAYDMQAITVSVWGSEYALRTGLT